MRVKKIKLAFFFFTFFSINILLSQTVEISGLVIAKDNIEGIHIINKTSQKFTTTNALGVFLFLLRDENFSKSSKNKSDIDVLEYLKEKYSKYLINLNRKEDWII